MLDRRIETRILCSDLVSVDWKDEQSRKRRGTANLEDISQSGLCVQLERPTPLNTAVRVTYGKGIMQGIVRYCIFRDIGYFIGVEFAPGTKWSRRDFRPRHMLDPRKLAEWAANAEAGSKEVK